MTDGSMKDLLFYRKAIKTLVNGDKKKTVWYVSGNNVNCMQGNTVLLLLCHGIYKFYDTKEEAMRAKGKGE